MLNMYFFPYLSRSEDLAILQNFRVEHFQTVSIRKTEGFQTLFAMSDLQLIQYMYFGLKVLGQNNIYKLKEINSK